MPAFWMLIQWADPNFLPKGLSSHMMTTVKPPCVSALAAAVAPWSASAALGRFQQISWTCENEKGSTGGMIPSASTSAFWVIQTHIFKYYQLVPTG